VNPIRPNLAPSVQPSGAPKPADAARLAAQKAFFDIALGKAAPAAAVAPVQASAAVTPARAATPAQRTTQVAADAPARPLRPGSLLDIRV
jgi:hypothetical protein